MKRCIIQQLTVCLITETKDLAARLQCSECGTIWSQTKYFLEQICLESQLNFNFNHHHAWCQKIWFLFPLCFCNATKEKCLSNDFTQASFIRSLDVQVWISSLLWVSTAKSQGLLLSTFWEEIEQKVTKSATLSHCSLYRMRWLHPLVALIMKAN